MTSGLLFSTAMMTPLYAENFHDCIHAVQHRAGIFQRFPVVGGNIRLAFCAVNNQRIDFSRCVELYMSGKACSAQDLPDRKPEPQQ